LRTQRSPILSALTANSIWFQVLFHSVNNGTFHLSLTVLVHYRCCFVFSLRAWSPQIPSRYHVSRGTQVLCLTLLKFRIRDFHPLWSAIPSSSTTFSSDYAKPYNTLTHSARSSNLQFTIYN